MKLRVGIMPLEAMPCS